MDSNSFFLNFSWHATNRWAYTCEDEIPEHTQDCISGIFHDLKDTLRIDTAVGGIAENKQTKVLTLFMICRKPKKKFLMIVKEISHEMTAEDIEREKGFMKAVFKLSRLS